MLDFTKAKKNFLTIKLYDGTTIFVGMPKKAVFSQLLELREALNNTEMEDIETIGEIYSLAASILSNNKANKEITADYVSKTFDIEDISRIYNAYISFATGAVAADPN